jgi:hypothetical protein
VRRSIKWIGNLQITANSSSSHDFQNAVLDKFAERTRTSASNSYSKRRLLNVGRLILLLEGRCAHYTTCKLNVCNHSRKSIFELGLSCFQMSCDGLEPPRRFFFAITFYPMLLTSRVALPVCQQLKRSEILLLYFKLLSLMTVKSIKSN